jgi:hypothetical protein
VDFNLARHQKEVRQLYLQGVAEAKSLNRQTKRNILAALGLNMAPESATLVYAQPKGNEKRFVVTRIKLEDGERRDVPEGYVYQKPEVLGKKQADGAKKRTPAVTFAGFFQPERNSDYFLRASGLYPLDFDAVTDLNVVWRLVTRDKNAVCAFISITGSGLKVIVRGPLARNAIEYSAFYEAIAVLKAKAWGLATEIDRDTKDCSRLCFLAYDPDVYFNCSAVALTSEVLKTISQSRKPEENGTGAEAEAAISREATPKHGAPKGNMNGLPLEIGWGTVPDLNWDQLSLAHCLDALRYIDPCCDRETWRIVGAAMKTAFGEEAFVFFDLWSSHGGSAYTGIEDCRRLWDGHKRESGRLVTPASILRLAKDNGFKIKGNSRSLSNESRSPDGLPDETGSHLPMLDVSSGRDWNLIAANAVECIMKAEAKSVFLRDDCGKHMVEVITNTSRASSRDGKLILSDVRPVEFASLISRFATLVKLDARGNLLRSTIDQKVSALIMAAAPIRKLPVIRGLSNAPVLLLCRDDSLRVIGPGYDRQTGIYVTGDTDVIPTPDWKRGRDRLLGLAYDYKFPSEGDRARFIGAVLTPALVVGQFLRTERVPLTVFEADESQTGKGYATKLIGGAYGESPQQVVQKKGGGLGSLQDSFDSALLRGRPFISFDNMRDRLDLPCLESFATEDSYPARGFHKDYIEVNPNAYIIFITSNGVSVTSDIVKRFNLIRFQKQPTGYKFWHDEQGRRMLPHVRRYQHLYQGAIWSVLSEWHRRGMPTTDEARHDFWAWSQSLDWIVQNLFDLPPLLEGFEEIRHRMVSEYWSFVRQLCLAVKAERGLGKEVRAGKLAAMCSDNDIRIPGLRSTAEDADAKQIGIIMVSDRTGAARYYYLSRPFHIVPSPPPNLSPPTLASNGDAGITVNGGIGLSYRIQTSSDLNQWIDWTNFVSSASTTQCIDLGAGLLNHRFYRVASPEQRG